MNLRTIGFGVLIPKRSFKIEMLPLMKRLCFYLDKNMLFLIYRVLVKRWSSKFLNMSLKEEIVFLILVGRTILKKPTLRSTTFLVLFLKNISLQTATLLLVIGHVR